MTVNVMQRSMKGLYRVVSLFGKWLEIASIKILKQKGPQSIQNSTTALRLPLLLEWMRGLIRVTPMTKTRVQRFGQAAPKICVSAS
jgi:hypothetical protein